MKNQYLAHQNLIAKTLPVLQAEFPNLRLFPRHVGLFYTQRGNPVQINTKGMYDYWGLYSTPYYAIHIEIEFKTGNARKSKEQLKWGAFLDSINCHHFLINENNLDEVIFELKNLAGDTDPTR